jgi:hypothetical protein
MDFDPACSRPRGYRRPPSSASNSTQPMPMRRYLHGRFDQDCQHFRSTGIYHAVASLHHQLRFKESSGRAHSVPRPAFGGAMLTLLRVRRAARLRRRPELDGASRPLHRAGSWQPSFASARLVPCHFLRPSGRISNARQVRKSPAAGRHVPCCQNRIFDIDLS